MRISSIISSRSISTINSSKWDPIGSRDTPHVGETPPYMGSLPVYWESLHIWRQSPCMGSNAMYGEAPHASQQNLELNSTYFQQVENNYQPNFENY